MGADSFTMAYADPPYLGMGKLYADRHPQAHDWDTVERHIELIEQLEREFSDGWAMSVSTPSLATLLPLCPSDVRIAAWVKPFAAFKRNVRIAYTWEPVIFRGGHLSSTTGASVGRDHLAESIAMMKGFPGAKPERFCFWVMDLLGWIPGDTITDLFPGTGVFGRVVDHRESSPVLEIGAYEQQEMDIA